MRKTQQKGFTLAELVVVVLIISILSSIAIPQYKSAVAKARYTEVQTAVEQLNDAQEMYAQEHGWYTDKFSKLKDFSIPGWTANGENLLEKRNGNGRLIAQLKMNVPSREALQSGEATLAGDTQTIQGVLYDGRSDSADAANETNSYVLYLPHGENYVTVDGARRSRNGVRECWAKVPDGEKFRPRYIGNRVCDGVGAVRCEYKDGRNIFVIEAVTGWTEGSSPGNVVKRLCTKHGYTPDSVNGSADKYYKGTRVFQQWTAS